MSKFHCIWWVHCWWQIGVFLKDFNGAKAELLTLKVTKSTAARSSPLICEIWMWKGRYDVLHLFLPQMAGAYVLWRLRGWSQYGGKGSQGLKKSVWRRRDRTGPPAVLLTLLVRKERREGRRELRWLCCFLSARRGISHVNSVHGVAWIDFSTKINLSKVPLVLPYSCAHKP